MTSFDKVISSNFKELLLKSQHFNSSTKPRDFKNIDSIVFSYISLIKNLVYYLRLTPKSFISIYHEKILAKICIF